MQQSHPQLYRDRRWCHLHLLHSRSIGQRCGSSWRCGRRQGSCGRQWLRRHGAAQLQLYGLDPPQHQRHEPDWLLATPGQLVGPPASAGGAVAWSTGAILHTNDRVSGTRAHAMQAAAANHCQTPSSSVYLVLCRRLMTPPASWGGRPCGILAS